MKSEASVGAREHILRPIGEKGTKHRKSQKWLGTEETGAPGRGSAGREGRSGEGLGSGEHRSAP